jgi:ryanodine receptor 2
MPSDGKRDYQPQPIAIDGIHVGEDLNDLIEALARNAHEVWALQRLADGWTLGESRSDKAKTHPCLVSYEELPENEKEYDRIVVRSTIRAILALGFRVSRATHP